MERLLTTATEQLGPISLEDDLTFSQRAAVARLRLADDTTVIAKLPGTARAFANEVGALRTLPGSSVPELISADGDLIVMEDLGGGPSLADLLLGGDPIAAEAGLIGWAECLGHALRSTLRPGPDEDPDDPAEVTRALRAFAQALGAPVPRAAADEIALVVSTLERPGRWLAFCPGDTCPDNNRVMPDGSVRLFDFEAAGWRHAAREAAYCRAPFCTCWCVAALPDGMVDRMENAFLDALNPPEVEAFVRTIPAAVVWYTLTTLDWFTRFALEDLPVGPDHAPSTGRQYVHRRLRVIAAGSQELPALADLADRLAREMANRWPDCSRMPLYPAFRRG